MLCLKNISVRCTFVWHKTGLHHKYIFNDVGFIVNYATKILFIFYMPIAFDFFYKTKMEHVDISAKMQLQMRFNKIESPFKKETQYIIIFQP